MNQDFSMHANPLVAKLQTVSYTHLTLPTT